MNEEDGTDNESADENNDDDDYNQQDEYDATKVQLVKKEIGKDRFGGITLFNQNNLGAKISDMNEINEQKNYFMMLPPATSAEKYCKSIRRELKKKKIGEKYVTWVCYQFDATALPKAFDVQEDTNGRSTLYPRYPCPCDEIIKIGDQNYYVSHQLLRCGGWIPYGIVIRANGKVAEFSDDCDEELWGVCVIIHYACRYHVEDVDEFDHLLSMLNYFSEHRYQWDLQSLSSATMRSWRDALRLLCGYLEDYSDILTVEYVIQTFTTALRLRLSQQPQATVLCCGASYSSEHLDEGEGIVWHTPDMKTLLCQVKQLRRQHRPQMRLVRVLELAASSAVVRVCVCRKNAVMVVELCCPPLIALELLMVLREEDRYAKEFLQQVVVACVAGSDQKDSLSWDVLTTALAEGDHLPDEITVAPGMDDEVDQSIFCTVYKTSACTAGEATASAISHILTFLTCHAWDKKTRQDCVVLCLHKDSDMQVDHIFTNTKRPDLWGKEMARKLCCCSLLAEEGCQMHDDSRITVSGGFFFVVMTLDCDERVHGKITEVVEQGLESAGIGIQRKREFVVERE